MCYCHFLTNTLPFFLERKKTNCNHMKLIWEFQLSDPDQGSHSWMCERCVRKLRHCHIERPDLCNLRESTEAGWTVWLLTWGRKGECHVTDDPRRLRLGDFSLSNSRRKSDWWFLFLLESLHSIIPPRGIGEFEDLVQSSRQRKCTWSQSCLHCLSRRWPGLRRMQRHAQSKTTLAPSAK